MKRYLAVLMAVTLAGCLWACGPAQAPAPIDTAPPQVSPVPEPDETKEAFAAVLADIRENYHPGTAGCSLTAARLAGTLLDWNAGARWDPAAVTAQAKGFYEGLDPAAAAGFAGEQLPGIYDAATALFSDTARDLLDAAGYAPASYPWAEEGAERLFSALYEGVGLTLPK